MLNTATGNQALPQGHNIFLTATANYCTLPNHHQSAHLFLTTPLTRRSFAKKYRGYTVNQDRYHKALRILNCDTSHSLQRCHEAYMRLAKIYHPDAAGGDKNKFIQIRQAYEEVEIYMKSHDPTELSRQWEEEKRAEKERREQYWRDHPEEYQEKLRREREYEAARAAEERRKEEMRAQKRREEEERQRAYERYREEQRKREAKYKIKVELDDEARERLKREAAEEVLRKQRLQQEEQERLARESVDRSSSLEQARKDAARRQKLAEQMAEQKKAGPTEEELEQRRQAKLEAQRRAEERQREEERARVAAQAEREAFWRRQEAMRASQKAAQGQAGQKYSGAVDAPAQQASQSFAGVALLFVFAGSVAAFTGGAIKLSGEDRPTKHTAMDVSAVRESLKEDGDQKKKVLEQQAALRRRLQIQSQKKIEQQLKAQTETVTRKGPIRRRYDGSGSLQRKLDALKNRKELETEPDKMKTYPRIPFQRTITLRPRATPMEAERFFQLNFEQDLDDWIKKGYAAPSPDELSGVLNETTLKKLDCVPSARRCSGTNPKVFSGEFEHCGKLAPFYLWRRFIDEKAYDEDVQMFMDQYQIDPFVVPLGAEESINRFLQSRYGLFTCQDSQDQYGQVSIDRALYHKWEGNDEQRRKTWTLAILTALQEGAISIETLGQYRSHFKNGRKFQKYLKSHPHHEARLVEQRALEREKTQSIFKKKMEYEDFVNFNTTFMREWI